MGQLDKEKSARMSNVILSMDQWINELKELIEIVHSATQEVATNEAELKKSLDRLHNFIKNE
jgi:hypothetical protein